MYGPSSPNLAFWMRVNRLALGLVVAGGLTILAREGVKQRETDIVLATAEVDPITTGSLGLRLRRTLGGDAAAEQ